MRRRKPLNEKTYLTPDTRPPEDPIDLGRTVDSLATVIMSVLVVGVLYLAREILVPVAIAVLLSFVLSPLIKALRKLGLGKKVSVGIAVLSTFLIAVGLGAVLATQVSNLAAQAPKLQSTVTQKVDSVRSFASSNPLFARLNSLIADMQSPSPQQKNGKPVPAIDQPHSSAAPLADKGRSGPVPVQVVSPPPGVLTILQAAIGMAASPLATAAFVAVFIVFILMQREDLRNRFIRLAGSGDLQRTTLAMNDAARRLSRYFLAQVLLNTGFGVAVAVALLLLGVPGALLWGIVAAFMRFVPYIGAVGAAFFPVLLAAAVGPGWALTFETALFFVVLELILGQVVEPLVYGHNTGISPIAVVASATFWTWLWGPVGLVLSTPMTVILVVLGRHVSRLSFLDVLLGDAPALTQVEVFYQRMLSGDPSELLDHAEAYVTEHSALDYSEQIAMRALLTAQADVRRGTLDEKRQRRIRDTMRDLAGILDDRDDETAPADDADTPPAAPTGPGEEPRAPVEVVPPVEIDPAWTHGNAVLCFAARTPLDEAAAHLLVDLLHARGIGAHVEPADSAADADALRGTGGEPRLAVLSFLDADLSVTQARFAVRRLRRRIPGIPLLAAFWMAEDDRTRLTALCESARCDECVSGLPDALRICLERAAMKSPAARREDAAA